MLALCVICVAHLRNQPIFSASATKPKNRVDRVMEPMRSNTVKASISVPVRLMLVPLMGVYRLQMGVYRLR